VVFLQHPREARMPVSTCRLAHLSLPNSEMHVGLRPEGSPRLEALVRQPGTMVLFPGRDAVDVRALPTPPRTLIVVDGTWINARKVVERSALLSALPRLGFTPTQPGNYRIRREPAAHCLSTIEAVAHVLEALEGAPGRFTPMLGSFDRMVDLQLGYIAARGETDPPRRHPVRVSPADQLRNLGDRLVLVFAEGNVWPPEAAPPGPTDVLQWVAIRPATGERFESVLRPRRPLAPYAARYVGVPLAELEAGEGVDVATERWGRFARADDVAGTWGRFSVDLLRGEGIEPGALLDLKRLVSNVLHAPLGGVEHLAGSLGAVLPDGRGRAVRKLLALDHVVRALLTGALRSPRP
jgi:DTW domain-containing protein YfiP